MFGKITIIGCGSVGANLGFNVLNRIKPQELVLVDINLGLAKGVALDLEDTRGILNFCTRIKGTDNYSNIKNSKIVVITAGLARRPGMTRLDLLRINAKITSDISRKIKKFAPTSVVVVVTNPLDFMTYLVTKETGFSRKKVLGMGSSLDTSRLFNIISNQLDMSSLSLGGFIYGPHSKDMIVEKTKLSIAGVKIDKFINNKDFLKLKKSVQLRGAEIVKNLKTRSACFAPALACCNLIEAIAFNENRIFPVSVLLKGEYGLKDVCLGVSCLINSKGIEKIVEFSLTSKEKKELKKAEKVFRECMI